MIRTIIIIILCVIIFGCSMNNPCTPQVGPYKYDDAELMDDYCVRDKHEYKEGLCEICHWIF